MDIRNIGSKITGGIFPPGKKGGLKNSGASSIATPGDQFRKSEGTSAPLISKACVSSSPSASAQKWRDESRPARLIKTDPDGKMHIDNVRWGFTEAENKEDWKSNFSQASIDPSKIKDIYMCVEPFAPEWIAGHALMRFEFQDDAPVKTPDGKTDDSLVVSVEARTKEGQGYSLIDGFKKKFGVIYSLSTWKDTIQKSCRKEGHKLIRYKLKLSRKQKEELLKNALSASFKNRDGEFYHTTRNSCFSNQVKLLNTVLPGNQKFKEWIIPGLMFAPTAALPNGAGVLLNHKGLLDESPIVITQPDKKLFADKQVKQSILGRAMKKISETHTWHVVSTLSGMTLGAAVGSLIPFAGIGMLVGGTLGGVSGYKGSQWVEKNTHFVTEPSEKYFQQGNNPDEIK